MLKGVFLRCLGYFGHGGGGSGKFPRESGEVHGGGRDGGRTVDGRKVERCAEIHQ